MSIASDYKDVPNLDGMMVEELEEYRRSIQDKQGKVWEDIKLYVYYKQYAIYSRLQGFINEALYHESKCDSIYQNIKDLVDW